MSRLVIQISKSDFIDYPTKGTPEDFKKFMDDFLDWQCTLIVKRIREVVHRQLYSWHPLSPSYLAWKKKMNLDPGIWIASGQLTDAIKHWSLPYDETRFYIGVNPTVKHRNYIKGGIGSETKGNARLINIIRWLEFGTTKMKGRPLFTKVLSEFKPKSRQNKLYAQFIEERKGLTK